MSTENVTIINAVPEEGHGAHVSHVHRDDLGSKMGMWLFLFTELLLFGGLFLLYMAYRVQYPEQFHTAAKELNVLVGTLNTLILLTSSLTMALSIAALQRGKKTLSLVLIGLTIAFALGFMVNKYFEWSHKFEHGIFPGGSALMDMDKGEKIFFGLYYAMTGLHGLHIIVGVVLLSFMYAFVKSDNIKPDYIIKLENAGLYWHLVDLIWIFLFPLFYLIH